MDDSAIAKTRAEFVAALQEGDAAAASAVYAADAQLLAPSAELFAGRNATAALWQAGLQAGIAAVELDELTLAGNDGVAWEIGATHSGSSRPTAAASSGAASTCASTNDSRTAPGVVEALTQPKGEGR